MNENYLPSNVKTLRNLHELSQKQLAEKLKVSRQVVSVWEEGSSTPGTATAIKIAENFGVSLNSLISYDLKNHCIEKLKEI